MKKWSFFLIGFAFFACQNKDVSSNDTVTELQEHATELSEKKTNLQIADKSTFDIPRLKEHTESTINSLKLMEKVDVFSTLHNENVLTLNNIHKDYFKSNSGYYLVTVASGDLFQEGKKDFAFLVYDKFKTRFSIVLFNESEGNYSELYRQIPVLNGLYDADCNFGAFGTLDYQLAYEMTTRMDFLSNNPLTYLEEPTVLVRDLNKDERFNLQEGCFSKNADKKKLSNTLCISTSAVYNNWDCLRYNKELKAFEVYFGQAFAD